MSKDLKNGKINSGGVSKPQLELQNTIKKLNDEIKSLEKVNAILRDQIAELENENKDLREKYDAIKAKKVFHPHIEDNIINLQKKIAKLEIENKRYLEELGTLKGEEKVSEIPVGKVLDFVSKRNAALDVSENGEVWKEDQILEIPAGRVGNLINKRNAILESREAFKEITPMAKEPVREINGQLTDASEIESPSDEFLSESKSIPPLKLELEQKKAIIETSDGKRICPKCGNQNKRLIREIIDKTKLICVYPKIYGKKFKCGECGVEWR